MNNIMKNFNDWLDKILCNFNLNVKAFCFNIYECAAAGDYTVELTAFDEYDEEDDDWSCGGTETYASRNDDNEFAFHMQGEWEDCLKEVGIILTKYIQKGKYAEKLTIAEVVAYGFVDGDLEIAYKKDLS